MEISKLPDELVAKIFDFATLSDTADSKSRKRNYGAIQKLALASRRAYRIVTPFLYEEIRLSHPHLCHRCRVPPMQKARKLHRVLQQDPALHSMCFSLYLDIDDSEDNHNEDFHIYFDMITWLTNLRSLVIVGGFSSHTPLSIRQNTLSLINRAQHLCQLRDLRIEGNMWDEEGGISLAESVKHIDSQSLETIEVSASGLSSPSTIAEMSSPDVRIETEVETTPANIPQKMRSASFKSLKLVGCKDYRGAIEALILWPKELVHFAINTSGSSVSTMNLHDIEVCLLPHKDTLNTVFIDLLGFPHGMSFNACNFPHLEVLRLSRTQICEDPWNRVFEWDPVYADLLLGPRLHTFGLVFGVMGHSLINNWGHKEEEWIRQLAKAAWKRKAPLKTIEINFSPVSPYPNFKQGTYPEWEYVYPWDRMDSLGSQIQRFGLSLEYTAPPWTKEEWLSAIHPR